MNKSNVSEPEEREGIADPLTELLRAGEQQLIQQAEKRWRRLRGFHDLSKVITGVKFNDGIEVSNVDQAAA